MYFQTDLTSHLFIQEISNELSGLLAQYLAQPMPAASETAQQKSYVTYTVPSLDLKAPRVTLLEAPSLLASSGTTGYRTWEAALFLGAYLSSTGGRSLVAGQNVIELGAGTGFLSILCAKHLRARHVLSTDGSREVLSDLQTNLNLNALTKGQSIQASILLWGQTLINDAADFGKSSMYYNLAIGADITYDVESIPSLIATLRDLFNIYPDIQILISATIRNPDTIDAFISACVEKHFSFKTLDIAMPPEGAQIGFFIPTTSPIRIFRITREEPAK